MLYFLFILFIRLAKSHGPYYKGYFKNTSIQKCLDIIPCKVDLAVDGTHRQY